MKKIAFVFSAIVSIIGILVLFTTSILNHIMPMIGRTAFQTATGSYSPDDYVMNFTSINTMATILVIIGLCLCIYLYISDQRE